MMKRDIMECHDIEILKQVCLEYQKQEVVVSEILVEESKWHISAKDAVDQIRKYLVDHQYDIDLIFRNGGTKHE